MFNSIERPRSHSTQDIASDTTVTMKRVVTLGLWLACLFAVSPAAELNSACTTPRSQAGVCIRLNECAELNALMREPRPLPASTIALLRSSQCGVIERQPLVCCRLSSPVQPTEATTPPPAVTAPPPGSRITEPVPPPEDVSTHRNLALINPEFCGQGSTVRIIGGNKTGIFDYPWMALLNYRSTKGRTTTESFKCGGSLINDRYILTAAHCISNTVKLKLIGVRLGEHDTSTEQDCEIENGERYCAPPYQDIAVESFIRHPEYNPKTYANDIALIRMAQPADTTKDTVKAICLPVGLAEQTKNLDGKKLIVAGWGFTETGLVSPELLQVSLPVMPLQQCHSVYYNQFGFSINGKQLCAGGTNLTQDSCRGDSGGPFMIHSAVDSISSMVQYGVVSYGHRHCGTEGVPGVYTRVGYYMAWILNNLQP